MNTLEMIRGTSFQKKIIILKNGVPYSPKEGDIFRFGVKESELASRYLIKREWTAAKVQNGTIVLEIAPEDTLKMPMKTYKWDIGLQNGENYQIIIPYSNFILKPNITTWEDKPNE